MNTLANSKKTQRGTTLLEALIAIVVLAFGMLGIAGLNLANLKVTQEGGNRNTAALLTQEITDKLRATQETERILAVNALGATAINSSAALNNCYTANCTAVEQAAHELIGWAKSIDNAAIGDPVARGRASRLPGGLATVCFDDTPNDGTPTGTACTGDASHPLVVKIWWNERPSNATQAAPKQVLYATSVVL